jgi:hypothetical protein
VCARCIDVAAGNFDATEHEFRCAQRGMWPRAPGKYPGPLERAVAVIQVVEVDGGQFGGDDRSKFVIFPRRWQFMPRIDQPIDGAVDGALPIKFMGVKPCRESRAHTRTVMTGEGIQGCGKDSGA